MAQVDSGSKFYKSTKQSKQDNGGLEDTNKQVNVQEKQEVKVHHSVPQIGALGAFSALTGGLIGRLSMSQRQSPQPIAEKDEVKNEVESLPSSTHEREKSSEKKKTSFIVGGEQYDEIAPEVDLGRKYSKKYSHRSAEFDPTNDYDTPQTGKNYLALINIY